MDLKTYIDNGGRGTLKNLARTLGITPIYLGQLANRTDGREPAPALAVKIEEATDGKVTRKTLRPHDYQDIWPDLRPKRRVRTIQPHA